MKRLLFLFATPFVLVLACSKEETTVEVVGGPGDGGESVDASDAAPVSTNQCTSARTELLTPIASVSSGAVDVVGVASTSDGTKIYVDATAGGINNAAKNPRIYIKFDGTKAAISDTDAFTSTGWDLALKRTDIYTNSGDAGPGQGGGVLVAKDFASVTAADATGLATEKFFDASCSPIKDEAGFLMTTFEGWYAYDTTTNIPSAKPHTTFVVKAADGTLYKLAIESNTAQADGGTGSPATAYYLLHVKKL